MKKMLLIIAIFLMTTVLYAMPKLGGRLGWVNHSGYEGLRRHGGFGFSGILEIPINEYFGIREQIGYNSFCSYESGMHEWAGHYDIDFFLNDFAIGNYLKLTINPEQQISLYACAGIGIHILSTLATLTKYYVPYTNDRYSKTEFESSTRLGIDLIVGTVFHSGNIDIFGEIGYNIVKPQKHILMDFYLPISWDDPYNELMFMGGVLF